MSQLYLASASARRRELLGQIGVPFQVMPADIDESVLPGEAAESYVERLAITKAQTTWRQLGNSAAVVLGADTSVVLEGRILGKPTGQADAMAMLSALSGREHQVMTAVALVCGEQVESCVVTTTVRFRTLSTAEMEAYWRTGEPLDKAGSYGIQGLAAVFVSHIQGSYSAVVGLPLCETAQLLARFSLPCWQSIDT